MTQITTARFKTQMLEFGGHAFILHPDRALVWPARRTLIVADLHFGKAALFRERGLPVPSGTTAGDLARLDQLVEQTEPTRLLILGDCFHGKMADPAGMYGPFKTWRARRPSLRIELVRGNHDRHAGDAPDDLCMTVHHRPLSDGGLTFAHEPIEDGAQSVICGHIHPAATLRDFDGGGVRVPCFVVEKRLMILPAFGRFTGSCNVSATEDRRLYIAAGGRVLSSGPLARYAGRGIG